MKTTARLSHRSRNKERKEEVKKHAESEAEEEVRKARSLSLLDTHEVFILLAKLLFCSQEKSVQESDALVLLAGDGRRMVTVRLLIMARVRSLSASTREERKRSTTSRRACPRSVSECQESQCIKV